jgi:lipopolysaccharide transport system permease protein
MSLAAETLVANLSEAEATAGPNLMDRPLVRIRAGRRRIPIDAGELWEHRDLLFFLTWRDVKVRYKQTMLGAAWAILQPLLTMVVFTLLFGRLARVPSDGLPYPIFVYAGLLPWTFFSTAVTNGSNSLVGSAALITKVYFPRLAIPSAAVGAGLVDFFIAGVILAGMMVLNHVVPGWNLLLIPALVLLTAILALGIGLWMSALNVKYRDIRYALPFVLQIWMYLTPVIYPVSFIPARYRWVLRLNPLSGIIEGYRSALFGRAFDWSALSASTIITFAIALYSVYAFKRMEREFADII